MYWPDPRAGGYEIDDGTPMGHENDDDSRTRYEPHNTWTAELPELAARRNFLMI
jgi:hypothetical protein